MNLLTKIVKPRLAFSQTKEAKKFFKTESFSSFLNNKKILLSTTNSNLSAEKKLINRISTSNYVAKLDLRNFQQKPDQSSKNSLWYILSGFVFMIGASYAAVPLFKIFCESQGIDINTEFREMGIEELKKKLSSLKKVENRLVTVKFVASTSADLLWKFEPCQEEITVAPGETALAFFKAKNMTNRSIIGIATYSILPFDAGLYFNKIQCFCFEEQRLDPNEEVDMPVFFYIDEQYTEDPKLEYVDNICLSYTFFESKGADDIQNLQKLVQQKV
ncbi:cytochrome c oxidase assembly mitochondrial [Brachionus plicatilis]|uniref:Cytochrome c oxidase assembly protein COX11, mitochondrial n=1 Tax=Brachionus plicatilis TaxID=10195 RepID=A0A3M7QAD8_BRAPC|nr:cytochrome c oxidase assembly mitochondrial [Brachionus plicatilis]